MTLNTRIGQLEILWSDIPNEIAINFSIFLFKSIFISSNKFPSKVINMEPCFCNMSYDLLMRQFQYCVLYNKSYYSLVLSCFFLLIFCFFTNVLKPSDILLSPQSTRNYFLRPCFDFLVLILKNFCMQILG